MLRSVSVFVCGSVGSLAFEYLERSVGLVHTLSHDIAMSLLNKVRFRKMQFYSY